MGIRAIASCIACLAILFTTLPVKADLTREQRLADAQTMLALFEHRYAPIEWKKEYLGISFDDLASEFLQKIDRETMSDLDFYGAMLNLSAGLKDTHNWVIIPSSFFSRLGFNADYVDGHVLIDYVDREVLSEKKFPYYRGDELISIGNVPVEDIMEELAKFDSQANKLMLLRSAARSLTRRAQSNFPKIPTGETEVEIFSYERNKAETVKLVWKTSGRPLARTGRSGIAAELAESYEPGEVETPRQGILDELRWKGLNQEDIQAFAIGMFAPSFPIWDTFVQRTDSPLFSGVFFSNGKRIGFLRINTWSVEDPKSWLDFFVREIPFWERETDALVIDQTDNGGGDGCLVEDVMRFFVTEPVPSILDRIRANRYYLAYFEENAGYCDDGTYYKPEDCPLIYDIVEKMRKAIESGDILTEPLPTCSYDGYVHPVLTNSGEKVAYTKPVLLLVNERTISAADMSAALFQDAERAVIFGNRTCGAGGATKTIDHLGYSDFQVSQTQTIMWRPKEIRSPRGVMTHYIENVGVIPDVKYPITRDDFVNGYAGYKRAIEDTLQMMLK